MTRHAEMQRRRPNYTLDDQRLRLELPPWAHAVEVVAVVGTLLLAAFIYFGVLISSLLTFSALAAWFGWITTNFRRPPLRRTVTYYVIAVVALLLHAGEQHLGSYAHTVTQMFPETFHPALAFSDFTYTLWMVLAATALYLWGAVGLFFHHRLAGFAAWWVFTWSVVLPVSHFVIPAWADAGYTYVPGMATAPIVCALGITGILRLHRERLREDIA